ncbi:polyprotein [Cucumis melo var. makuwa]|uniref:Polyprotein n=1 Tax=Cucumis melo var. makuwa TaxID=1194695 RepID=A0A5D3DET5_CUCMM|nr:polyprotein [Cucumis melo var. makuwa]
MPSATIVSSPYKTINEEKTKIIGIREIKNIQQQLNYSNKVLTTLSRSIEGMKPDKLGKALALLEWPGLPKVVPNRPIVQPNFLDIKLKRSSTDELIEELTRKLSETYIFNYDSQKILPIKVYNTDMKNHYKRPSPPDLRCDDLHLDFRSFDGNNIETWNVEECYEGQMMIILQEMFVAATSYLRRMSQKEIIDALTAGFTGNLRSWWHNHLTDANREAIKEAVLEKTEQGPNGDTVTIQPN